MRIQYYIIIAIAIGLLLSNNSCTNNNGNELATYKDSLRQERELNKSLKKEIGKRDDIQEDYLMLQEQAELISKELQQKKDEIKNLLDKNKVNTQEYNDLLEELKNLIDKLSDLDTNYASYKEDPIYKLLFKTIENDIKQYKIIGTAVADVTKDRDSLKAVLGFYEDIYTPEAQKIITDYYPSLKTKVIDLTQKNIDLTNDNKSLRQEIAQKDSAIIKEFKVIINKIEIFKPKQGEKYVKVSFLVSWNNYEGKSADLYVRIYPAGKKKGREYNHATTMLGNFRDKEMDKFTCKTIVSVPPKKSKQFDVKYSDDNLREGKYLTEIYWNKTKIADYTDILYKFTSIK